MDNNLQVKVSYRQILKIALPISFAILVPQFNFVVNNIFLGHLSEEALAIASITGVYYLIFAGIGFGLNNGLQALISRRAGEDRPEEIGKIFQHGVLISLAIAATGILITYIFAPLLLNTFLHSEITYKKAISFLHIRILGLPFLYLYQMRNAFLVGTNQSKYLVAGTVAEALSNVFFDYVLIFGKLGFPQMGFNGAAYASIISEIMGLFVIFIVIKQKGMDKRFSLWKDKQWNSIIARSILKISGPLVLQHAMSISSWFLFFLLVERNSNQTGMAVSNTIRNIFGFFGVFAWSFSSTTNSMVSNVIGQGRKNEVIPLIKKIMTISVGISLIVCLLLNLFPHTYLSIYGLDESFIQAGIPVVRLVAFAMVLMSFATIWFNAVTGTGNSSITFLIELSAIFVYCIYVYLVLETYHLSIFWGWMSEILYWSILFAGSYLYMRSGRWKKMVV
jgi:putative MATE family efflux protein